MEGASALAFVPAGLKARSASVVSAVRGELSAFGLATGASSANPGFRAFAPEVAPLNAVTLPLLRAVAAPGSPPSRGCAGVPTTVEPSTR